MVESVRFIPQEGVQQRTAEHAVDVPVPSLMEEIAEVVTLITPLQRLVDHTVVVFESVVVEEILEDMTSAPKSTTAKEKLRLAEQVASCPFPRDLEQIRCHIPTGKDQSGTRIARAACWP